jgi:hypothetical protein
MAEEGETICCYAKSNKSWMLDLAGEPWEVYRTREDAEIFSTHSTQTDTVRCEPAFLARPGSKAPAQASHGCCS